MSESYARGSEAPPLVEQTIGANLDAINRGRFANNTAASLTAYTIVAILFLAVTIPFTRYLDHILRRQKLLTQAGQ